MSKKPMPASQSPKERTPSQKKNDEKRANINKQKDAFNERVKDKYNLDVKKPELLQQILDAFRHFTGKCIDNDGFTISTIRGIIHHYFCKSNGSCPFSDYTITKEEQFIELYKLVKYSLKYENISFFISQLSSTHSDFVKIFKDSDNFYEPPPRYETIEESWKILSSKKKILQDISNACFHYNNTSLKPDGSINIIRNSEKTHHRFCLKDSGKGMCFYMYYSITSVDFFTTLCKKIYDTSDNETYIDFISIFKTI